MVKYILSLVFILLFGGQACFAQEPDSPTREKSSLQELNVQLNAFYSLGGSAPLGIPREIQKIKGYNPGLQLGLELNATKWYSGDNRWGIRAGISVEGRGMRTQALVKSYLTEIIQEESRLKGYFTGLVNTHVQNTYASIPVSIVYRLSDRWNISTGVYASFLIDKQFTGYVSDGVFRIGDPTGEKVIFSETGRGIYDFSEDERALQWGVHVGADWLMRGRFKLLSKFNYGVNNLFKTDFTAISFTMHNIYLDLGFGYKF